MTKSSSQTGKVVILSGPSGVGKTSISRQIIQRLGAFFSVSLTTRPIGAGEKDGVDYHFVSKEDFERALANHELLEYACVFGNYYGTPRKPVEEALAAGRIALLEIDVEGARQVVRHFPDAVTIFILPPRKQDLAQRLQGRNRGEDEQARLERLQRAEQEMAAAVQEYKYRVVNDDLNKAVEEVIQIIQKECQPISNQENKR
jgi:guanylate kinase